MKKYHGNTFSVSCTFPCAIADISRKFYQNPSVTFQFYCATIAYHVELNAISGGRRNPANIQKNKNLVLASALTGR